MSSQIPFSPVTPEALGRLTPIEQQTFAMAAELLADGQKPSMMTIVALVGMVQRLITEPAEAVEAERERIRRLAIARGAVWCERQPCTCIRLGSDPTIRSFADLIGEPANG